MIARGVHPGSRLTAGPLIPLGILSLVGAALVVWSALDVRVAGDGAGIQLGAPAQLEAVAYVANGNTADTVYVQRVAAGAVPSPAAVFAAPFGLHARGSTSPDGTRAVIIRADVVSGRGLLSVLDLDTLGIDRLEADADYLTNVTWKPGEPAIAVTVSSSPSEAGLVTASIVELDLITGESTLVANFEPVFEAEPVGYQNGALYIVAIDQSGSVLYRLEGGVREQVAQLSVGRTRNWVFEPGGARLAYLDVIGAGAGRAAIARVLLLSTGEITVIPGEDDHIGLAWRPGAELPDVGGPGGSLALEGADGPAVIVPVAWDPSGRRLLAEVTETGETEGLEVLSDGGRLRLTGGDVTPLGWVVDGP